MVTNSFEDFAAEIVEEQLNKKQELEIFTDEFLRPFEEMRALETNEDGTVSLVIFSKKDGSKLMHILKSIHKI